MHATTSLGRLKEMAGGNAGVARALNITPQAVSQWRRIPLDRVRELEAAFSIPRSELRPDVYPPEREAGRAA